jgi:hypothetical protein
MRGLDPRIHAGETQPTVSAPVKRSRTMDCRVRPGNDGVRRLLLH